MFLALLFSSLVAMSATDYEFESSMIKIDGKNVLILDDVCTTGTTLATAAMTVHHAAPNTVITLLTLGVTF